MSDDLHYLSLHQLSERLRRRELSSVEATQAILERIDRLDARLRTPERALADAERCDADIALGDVGVESTHYACHIALEEPDPDNDRGHRQKEEAQGGKPVRT